MNPLDALKRADEALKKQVEEKNRLKNERDRQYIMDAVAQSLPGMMSPLLHQVSENSRIASDEILSALQQVKIEQPKVDVNVTTPEAKVTVTNEPIKVPEISTAGIESAIERGIARAKFPKPEVNVAAPVVNVEAPEAPEPFDGEVTLKGVDKKRPLPVMMMGPDGNPFQMAQSAGGGRGDFYTIKDIQNSTGGSLIDDDGFLRVTGAFSVSSSNTSTQAIDSSGNVYSVANPYPVQVVSGGTATSAVNLIDSSGVAYSGSNPVPVTGSFTSTPGLQISGAVDSVNVVDAFGSTAVSGVFNADNRLRVSLETGGSGLTDSELRASSVPVSQVSGVAFSVSVNDVFGSTGTNIVNPDGRLKVELPTGASGLTDTELRATAVPVAQVSGASFSVNVSGAVGTIGVVTINPDGNPTYSSASSGLTDTELRASHLDVQQVSGATDSVNVVSTVGLTDTQLRASTLDIKQVSGSVDSVAVIGTVPVSVANTLEVIQVSGASNSVNVLNTVTVSGTVATGGLTNTELRATTVDVKQVSGSIDSVSVIGTPTVSVTDIFASVGTDVINPDGRIKVELPTGASGLTDTELRASSVPVSQVSGAGFSTNVTDIFGSTITTGVLNGDNRIRVSLETGGSGLTDAELRASHLDVVQMSGTIDSVYVTGVAASFFAEVTNPDNRLKVELPTGSSGLTDTELRATPVPVSGTVKIQDVNSSVFSAFTSGDYKAFPTVILDGSGAQITSFGGGTQYAEGASASTYTGTAVMFAEASSDVAKVVSSSDPLPVTLATKLDYTNDTISTLQLSGAIDSVYITGASGTLASNIVDSSGIAYSGSNPVPMTLAVSNATSTINATLVDSAGAYRGTLPVAVVAGSAAIGSVTVNGSTNSVIAVGPTLHGVADIGSAPQKVGGIVMQANPTAEVGGDVTNFRADDIGRQITRPMQVRDLIATAYVSVANGTETTLLAAGGAGVFHDLIKVVLSNNSTAAVGVNIRAVTGGNIVFHYEIPANGVVGESLAVPWPQDATNNNWTIDLPDITGTTVTASALFTKEV